MMKSTYKVIKPIKVMTPDGEGTIPIDQFMNLEPERAAKLLLSGKIVLVSQEKIKGISGKRIH